MSATVPQIGVVIPGRDSAQTLRPCLEALVPLLESGLIHRIVFVDDHSKDETARIARQYPVTVISSPRQGAGAARNVGWRATHTEYVWFVDSDCVVHPDALPKLRRTMSELGAPVVGGSYSNQNVGQLVADLIHEEMVARHRTMGRDVTFAITANLLCRRDTLEALSGFDESLRLGQDLDFAYRVVRSGRRLGFDATSRVGHFHETRLWHYLYKQARQGFWRVHIYRRHPERMSGDTYSGPLDYVQPPLALVTLGASTAGFLIGTPVLGTTIALTAGAGLVLCQLPVARALVQLTGDVRYWYYVPFGAMRAASRGVGMLLGIASLTLGEHRSSLPQEPLAPARAPARNGDASNRPDPPPVLPTRG
jgi:GT2 family glycosyltransferase